MKCKLLLNTSASKTCSICQSYEHLVEECPTIPVAREMFGEQANVIGQFKPIAMLRMTILTTQVGGTSKFFMEAKSTSVPTANSTISTIQQASSLEQAMVNLSKVVEILLETKNPSILNSVKELTVLTNLNTVQEKGRFPSQPHQNPRVPTKWKLMWENLHRNGLMQLTFGNVTLELNIFHMSKKLITPEEEEGPKEVCIIDTLVEEHCDQNMQDELNESLKDLEEGLSEPADVLATLQEVVRTEVLKLLQAGIIYPISDSPWVSPTQVVPKKSGITVVQNEKGEEIATCLTSGYFQIEIDVEDQEKTTFTCPFGTYAYRRMPFGLCNVPVTFQRCMLSIFSDMVERIMEVFMDDITIYGGIVLGHIISEKGTEVDKAKVELIAKLPSPTTVKGVRQFLGHQFLTTAPIVRAPNWQLPFEVMCDASDFAIGAVLGQREDGKPYVIYYASKTLNEAKKNYTTIEKELLAVVFALDKFCAYLRQERVENVVADHLSRLAIAHNSHVLPINDDFPEESLMLLEKAPWYAHIVNYLVTGEVLREWKAQDMKHFFAKIHAYYWEEPFLFKYCADQIIRKCVPEEEQQGILSHFHENACGGHLPLRKQP
ncbi:Retrovirus-related Pol polyprotein from transposon 17.6 [Vitis vinifera]|uniref:Retrovirus-related Pol polyprotein from transposon 17.6 n=1 Tax=Vitis vinifera TaxID=29760 RepID=A0A438C8U2_VITVI|nr:Retrovirus-related Pol polyprotein from transposon 17.6 [Vitis vinifera]